MKKSFQRSAVLLLLLLCATMLPAQNDSQDWKTQLPRHDCQFSLGDPFVTALMTNNLFFCSGCCPMPSVSDWFLPDTYFTGVVGTPVMNVSYHFRLLKWLWLGGTISYSGFYGTYYDRLTDEKCGVRNTTLFSIMPSVRFSWLNHSLVTLYSGVALGGGIEGSKYSQGDECEQIVQGHLTGQITAVGVEVGKKWYGFAESGFGYKGFFQLGFGCHFNVNKKK